MALDLYHECQDTAHLCRALEPDLLLSGAGRRNSHRRGTWLSQTTDKGSGGDDEGVKGGLIIFRIVKTALS
jgi:hypothetical protein